LTKTITQDDIVDYFKEIDWPLDGVEEETGRIFTSVKGQNVILEMEVGLNQEWQLLQITLTLPELVPQHRMAEAMALINRINYNLPLGHFEVGLESRHLAYYTAMPVGDLPFIKSQFETLLSWAIDLVDEEHPRLMQGLFSQAPPGEGLSLDQVRPQPPRRFDA